MSVAQSQHLHELQNRARLIKGKKTPECSRALEATVAVLEAKSDNSSDESLYADIYKPKPSNRNNPALDRKEYGTRQSHADAWQLGPSKGDSCPRVLRDSHLKPLCTIQVMVAHTSVASSKPKVELDSHADMCVIGDNCLVIHDLNRPVNVYSYDPKNGHRSAKTVDATVGYQYPQSGQKFILMINQAICIDALVNHMFAPCIVVWMVCKLMKPSSS